MPTKKIEQQLSFYFTDNLEETSQFYEDVLELQLVRDQGTCRIYKVGRDGHIGFCERSLNKDKSGVIITFVVDDVDYWAGHLKNKGVQFEKKPTHNPLYGIYHCFFRDPNGYLLEIQKFDEPLT